MFQRLKRMDGFIIVIIFSLMIISLLSIYSVTHNRETMDGFHIRMLRYYILGFVCFFLSAFFDFRIIIKYSKYIYILGLILLFLVSFIGHEENGAQGWIKVGGLTFQPAELFKLILILLLTYVFMKKQKSVLNFWKDIIPISVVALIPFVIVILQNDLGNGGAYIVILFGMIWIGNIKYSHALVGSIIITGILSAGIFTYIKYHDQVTHFLIDTIGRPHLVKRFDPWLMPSEASAGAVYHTKNAKLAIASGGLDGEGYMQGTSVQSRRVPYTYSDSIFVQIAEEFGFIGSAILLLLYFVLIHRMILIALECKNRNGPFIIVGIVTMLLYQILMNIGAFIGIVPLTGITLPFISYGGTSLIINMICLGIAMSVKLYGQEEEEELPNKTNSPLVDSKKRKMS